MSKTIFLLPFAVALTGLPFGAFMAMMVFLFACWSKDWPRAWMKGILTWK